MRKTVFAALEIGDEADILCGLDRGELEARVLQGQRVQAAAPPDVSSQLRLTAQAEGDALEQSADAHARHDLSCVVSGAALATQLAIERQRLEAGNAQYEQWSADTNTAREAAGKAAAELQRRGHAQPDGEPHPQPEDQPQPTAGWPRQFQADAEAAKHAIARQHQAAIAAGQPCPPQGTPEPDLGSAPKDQSVPAQSTQDDRAARLDELLAQADQAAQRIAAQQAERQASGGYAARLEREAQAQSEAEQQAEAHEGAEIEM